MKDYKEFLQKVSVTYGLNYQQLEKTIHGESGFNPEAVGPGGVSIGIGQFTLATWLGNCSKTDERRDPYKSMDCMGRLWAKGEQGRWDVYCSLFGLGNLQCIKRGL